MTGTSKTVSPMRKLFCAASALACVRVLQCPSSKSVEHLDALPFSSAAVKRGVGRPRAVSLEQIFAAAADIGLGNLTLPAVAGILGVTPKALYHHVKGREDLIAKFFGDVTERFPVPSYAENS